MSDQLQSSVENFISYFERQIKSISKLDTEHGRLYKQILYASIIDTLAGTAFPRRNNSDRFKSFIRRFCQWSEGDKVSLPHLTQLIKRNPDPAFEKLRKKALSDYKLLPQSKIPISADPTFNEINSIWPSSKEHRTPLEGIDLTHLQHVSLLYAYRNTLVHEFRVPGYGMELENDTTPFYHHMSHIENSANKDDALLHTTMELVYPWRFLHTLCDTALVQLKQYLIENELNPFDSRTFGTYWIKELNE